MDKSYLIEKLDHFGRGIININGKVGFVNNALINDEVIVDIIQEKKNYYICNVKKYIRRSNFRKDFFCKYSFICGGCDIGDLMYDQQLIFKKEKIKNIVEKYLKQDIKINEIIYCNDLNYRNKITLHVKNGKIGLYKKNSNDLIEIDSCYLVNPKINDMISRLKDFVKNKNITKITIKCTNLNEIMLVFYGEVIEKDVVDTFDCNCIFVNDKCLKDKYIYEKLGDYKFALSKDSFFQVNRFNTINLYNEVVNYVKNKKYKNVLDLYCGTGTIGIFVSKYVSNVVGIEVIKDAIESANINKEINDIKNISFLCGNVEEHINEFNNIDLVIADPPRSGIDKKTIDTLLKLKVERIIYVSCDIMTLIRDLNMLKDGYKIVELTPVDMFPNTIHCESITVLERK